MYTETSVHKSNLFVQEGSVESDSLEAGISKRDVGTSDYFEFLSTAAESEEEDSYFGTATNYGADDNFDNVNDYYTADAAESRQYIAPERKDLNFKPIAPEREDLNFKPIAPERRDSTYDPSDAADLPSIEGKGTYSLKLVGQRRLLRRERSATVNHLELPEATQSTLMARIDHSKFMA